MKHQLWACVALVGLAACGNGAYNNVVYEGATFRGDLSFERADRAGFVARGGPASASLEGARQAAAFRAVRHCIAFLGSSDIEWTNGPDVDDTALTIDDNEVVLTGRCSEP